MGRPTHFTSGSNARHHTGQGGTPLNDGPYSQSYAFDVWGNRTYIEGWGGIGRTETVSYTNNRRNGFSYDAAGNVTNDLGQTFTYDATGQQATASYSGYLLQQTYDGDRLRVKKVENGATTYYLRSSLLGGQIVAELNGAGSVTRGFVYLGGQLLAVQQNNQVSWVHQDPVVKSKRVTNAAGSVVSTIELDPWGGDTNRSSNEGFQPRRFTTYDRDGNGSDEAMHRRYNRWHSRFDQPDPYGGSYDLTDPQSFNRYSYTQNDPVNFVDPSGLNPQDPLRPPTTPAIDPATGQPHPGGVPGPVASLDVNIGRGERSGGAVGASSGPIELETPTSPTEAEVVPQNPITPELNDCLTFAEMVDDIANDLYFALASPFSGGQQAFMNRLATTFTEFRSAWTLAMVLQRVGYSNEGFGRFHDSGFHRDYRDPDPDSDNQVRHAAGGLIAGYILGSTPNNIRLMDLREDLNTASGRADARLNRITMPMGNMLRNGIGFRT